MSPPLMRKIRGGAPERAALAPRADLPASGGRKEDRKTSGSPQPENPRRSASGATPIGGRISRLPSEGGAGPNFEPVRCRFQVATSQLT